MNKNKKISLTSKEIQEYNLGGWISDNKQGVIGGAKALAGIGAMFVPGLQGVGAGMIVSGASNIYGEVQKDKQEERDALAEDRRIKNQPLINNIMMAEQGGMISQINGGETHAEAKARGGQSIPLSTDGSGVPSVSVERGETMSDLFGKVVHSNAFKINKAMADQYGLLSSSIGKTPAQYSKKIDKMFSRENDSYETKDKTELVSKLEKLSIEKGKESFMKKYGGQLKEMVGGGPLENNIISNSTEINNTGITQSQRLNIILDVIGKIESNNDYNNYNRGTDNNKIVGKSKERDLSELKISEHINSKNLNPNDENRVFAAGRYQFIPTTMELNGKVILKEVTKLLEQGKEVNDDLMLLYDYFSNDKTLTPEFQDALARYEFMKDPVRRKWIQEGPDNMSEEELLDVTNAIAKTWASFPTDKNQSKYGQGNKALIDLSEVTSLLKQDPEVIQKYNPNFEINSEQEPRETIEKIPTNIVDRINDDGTVSNIVNSNIPKQEEIGAIRTSLKDTPSITTDNTLSEMEGNELKINNSETETQKNPNSQEKELVNRNLALPSDLSSSLAIATDAIVGYSNNIRPDKNNYDFERISYNPVGYNEISAQPLLNQNQSTYEGLKNEFRDASGGSASRYRAGLLASGAQKAALNSDAINRINQLNSQNQIAVDSQNAQGTLSANSYNSQMSNTNNMNFLSDMDTYRQRNSEIAARAAQNSLQMGKEYSNRWIADKAHPEYGVKGDYKFGDGSDNPGFISRFFKRYGNKNKINGRY